MKGLIGQARAQHWVDRIRAAKENQQEKEAAEFWNSANQLIQGLGVVVRTNGLALALGIVEPKSARDPKQELQADRGRRFVIDGLADWLMANQDAQPAIYKSSEEDPASAPKLISAIVEGDVRAYMLAVEETGAWIEWGKALLKVEAARYPAKPKSASNEDDKSVNIGDV